MTLDELLKQNFQKANVNRYVIDSDRFWRKEFHPRFKDIFTTEQFQYVVSEANKHMSFKLDDEFVTIIGNALNYWFSGYRFADIPTKNPDSINQFLADLYFCLLDILPQMTILFFPLINDDFNVVTNRAETGKNDTNRLLSNEHQEQGSSNDTTNELLTYKEINQKNIHETDINTVGEMKQTNEHSLQNIDDETNTNTKNIQDTFLSPQDVGVIPISENIKGEGVDGITLALPTDFVTNEVAQNLGETVTDKNNTSEQNSSSEDNIQQTDDLKNTDESNDILQEQDNVKGNQSVTTDTNMNHEQENIFNKTDDYIETLDFDRFKKLLELDNLYARRLWNEILTRMSAWILQMNIATSETEYLTCPKYE